MGYGTTDRENVKLLHDRRVSGPDNGRIDAEVGTEVDAVALVCILLFFLLPKIADKLVEKVWDVGLEREACAIHGARMGFFDRICELAGL